MRILITGVTGFVGGHLISELRRHDPAVELWGLGWGEYDQDAVHTAAPGIHLVDGDLVEPPSVERVLSDARPDVIFHLAAASSVARSWDFAARSLEINAIGTVHLFDAVARLELDPIVVVSSTAEIYGHVPDGSAPLTEDTPIAPLSPYGTSKAAQDLLTGQFHAARGLAAVRVRFFNLTGPGRPDHFVASSFARQIAEIEAGLAPPVLRVGNLAAVRDFTDVRDAVRACRMAADRRHAGEVFHVCTGRGVAISEVVEQLCDLSRCDVRVDVDDERLRRSDISWLIGDPSKIAAATGWRAEIPLRQTLSDLLDWWRARLASDRRGAEAPADP
ncbi:MAG: GDP-mannose 4,6-dehydratase [Holophagae bacterium]|jgi:GDP-mannose 4,6-dehydratase